MKFLSVLASQDCALLLCAFPTESHREFSLVTRAELCSWDILLVTGDTHHLENTV